MNIVLGQWLQTSGPYGGTISSFATVDTSLFAGTASAGVFRSTDSGANWDSVNSGLTNLGIQSLAVSGTNLYVGTRGGVFRSTDNGTNWTAANTGLGNTDATALAVSGTNLFAGTAGGGVFRSTDNGASWDSVNIGLTDRYISTLAADIFPAEPHDDTLVFAGTQGGHAFRSIDNGESWVDVSAGLLGTAVGDLEFQGYNVFSATANGVFRMNVYDAAWTQVNVGLTHTFVYSLTINGANMYAGTLAGGVFRSTNNGANWTASGLAGTDISALTTSGSNLYAGTFGLGAFLSSDGGTSWSVVNNGLVGTNVYSVGAFGMDLFANSDGGIFLSSNDGASWVERSTGLTNRVVHSMAKVDTNLFAGTWGGVFVSTNNGASWDSESIDLSDPNVSCLAVRGTDLFAGTSGGGVFLYFNNDFWHWREVSDGLTNLDVVCLAASDSGLFAGTTGGVFRSTNGGENWGNITNNLTNTWVQTLVVSGAFLFAGTRSGVFRSSNNGTNWEDVTHNLPYRDATAFAASGTNLFVAVWGVGVFRSTDYGDTWIPINEGWTNVSVRFLAISGMNLFASTEGRGVWRRMLEDFGGGIGGSEFNDLNGNGLLDPGETPLVGWRIRLEDSSGRPIDSTQSDQNGSYLFIGLADGTYLVNQVLQDDWVRTTPGGLGYYSISIQGGSTLAGRDFGNASGYLYVGTSGGAWSAPGNWRGGRTPGPSDAVIVPRDTAILVDFLPSDSVQALRIREGGILSFSNSVGVLKIKGIAQTDSGVAMSFPSSNELTGVTCYSDFLNNGTLDAGHSTFTFSSNKPKSMVSLRAPAHQGTRFYNLRIMGDSTYSIGNITLAHALTLNFNLDQRPEDTLSLELQDASAIVGHGIIRRGSIIRHIQPGVTARYRFESDSTYVQFCSPSDSPTSIRMSSYPDQNPLAFGGGWVSIGGVVNNTTHSITVSNVSLRNRKWAIGKPRDTFAPFACPQFVRRVYATSVEGDTSQACVLSLRYEVSEIPPGVSEDSLAVYMREDDNYAMSPGWNLISLPVHVVDPRRITVYPTSISEAFAFLPDSGYRRQDTLSLGVGYWLKFGSNQTISIAGAQVPRDTLILEQGWNLIGSISAPVDTGLIIQAPPGIVTSSYFEYINSYSLSSTIEPGKGYWVKAASAGNLILQTPSLSRGILSVQRPGPTVSTITFRDASGRGQILFSTDMNDSTIDVARYEMPPSPPEGAMDIRFASGYMLAKLDASSPSEFPIKITSARYPVEVSIDGDGIRETPQLVVDDQRTQLERGRKITITKEPHYLVLALEESRYLPTEFGLSQNYPNPFNPSTTVSYQLPIASHIVLKVYNILGQEVKTLVEQDREAGYYSVRWDGTNNAGNVVGSGVYFYRIDAMNAFGATFMGTRKLVLLR